MFRRVSFRDARRMARFPEVEHFSLGIWERCFSRRLSASHFKTLCGTATHTYIAPSRIRARAYVHPTQFHRGARFTVTQCQSARALGLLPSSSSVSRERRGSRRWKESQCSPAVSRPPASRALTPKNKENNAIWEQLKKKERSQGTNDGGKKKSKRRGREE